MRSPPSCSSRSRPSPCILKATTSATAPGAVIERPLSHDGKTTYEGELGIVIGKPCTNVSADEADDFIFGYTCVNDVTANYIPPPSPNGRAPRVLTATGRSARSLPPASIRHASWCARSSTALSARTSPYQT
jgi:2-keto-4-pentenoate hydratase/2-oxohepta-3-ene-1,7-dioic acid hydratase in catechol pathway